MDVEISLLITDKETKPREFPGFVLKLVMTRGRIRAATLVQACGGRERASALSPGMGLAHLCCFLYHLGYLIHPLTLVSQLEWR